jgi:hypothetical protein
MAKLAAELAGRPAGLFPGDQMKNGIIAALALGLAVPAFAKPGDTNKDIKDSASNTVDDAKDKLGTDSGTAKTKRHTKKAARNAKKTARQTKNSAKETVGIK